MKSCRKSADMLEERRLAPWSLNVQCCLEGLHVTKGRKSYLTNLRFYRYHHCAWRLKVRPDRANTHTRSFGQNAVRSSSRNICLSRVASTERLVKCVSSMWIDAHLRLERHKMVVEVQGVSL